MLLTDTGTALFEHLGGQTDVPSLLISFQRVVRAFGMTGFCVGDPSNPEVKRKVRRWDGSWSGEIYRRYASHGFFSIDPIIARMNESSSPFRWSDAYARATPQQKRVLHEIMDSVAEDGLVVPIHGPRGAIAGISIGAIKYELSPQDEMSLQMASLYLHGRLTVLRGETPSRMARLLTPRERECLTWVAGGKTDWEISQILNISEQTVHGYVQNVLVKLNARTRAQAVALAMQAAQIHP
jgi:DNA-binding CsgD family transcriptional regulator